MKVTEFWRIPLWKSSWFVFGLVAIGFGLWGIAFPSSTEALPLDDLKVVKGVVKKVEVWSSRYGDSINVLYLSINGKEKRFNVNRCKGYLELLAPADVITIYTSKSFGVVDGSIWQIIKSGVTVCAYDNVVNQMERSETFQIKFALFALILGLLMAAIGVYRINIKK